MSAQEPIQQPPRESAQQRSQEPSQEPSQESSQEFSQESSQEPSQEYPQESPQQPDEEFPPVDSRVRLWQDWEKRKIAVVDGSLLLVDRPLPLIIRSQYGKGHLIQAWNNQQNSEYANNRTCPIQVLTVSFPDHPNVPPNGMVFRRDVNVTPVLSCAPDASTSHFISMDRADVNQRYLVMALGMEIPFEEQDILSPTLLWLQPGCRSSVALPGLMEPTEPPIYEYSGPAPLPYCTRGYVFLMFEQDIDSDQILAPGFVRRLVRCLKGRYQFGEENLRQGCLSNRLVAMNTMVVTGTWKCFLSSVFPFSVLWNAYQFVSNYCRSPRSADVGETEDDVD